MKSQGRHRKTAMAIVVLAAGAIASFAAREELKRVTSAMLGGKQRYATYVSTDKPIYRARETVYIRAVTLEANDRTPHGDALNAFFAIKGPKGNTVASGYGLSQQGTAGFSWTVPSGTAGGSYRIEASIPQLGIPAAQRQFDVRAYRAPRLRSQVEFLREGYGPGDKVVATLEVKRAEGGIPEDATVTITARVDGKEVHRSQSTVDRQGLCRAEFALPERIARGEGSIAFAIQDGGVVETAGKTIPILLQNIDVNVYPEGGELVAGMVNRVYLQAWTPARKPADIAGIIVDQSGRQVGAFGTQHEGRGRFAFTPQTNHNYHLMITEPAGITNQVALPPAAVNGVLIQPMQDVYSAGDPVALRVISSRAGELQVTLSKREAEVARVRVRGSREDGVKSVAEIEFTPPSNADGVLIATVWNEHDMPVAERLIYRQPRSQVNIEILPDQSRYLPGGKAAVKVRATDGNGSPVEAVVGVTVTDDSVLEMIEKREQAPSLPVMVFLEPEVQNLADAHVYLDDDNPEAPRDLDLLLGTQGWRRFVLVNWDAFVKRHGEAGKRVLALNSVVAPEESLERRSERGAIRKAAAQWKDVADGMVQFAPVVPVDAKPAASIPAPVIVAQRELEEMAEENIDFEIAARDLRANRDDLFAAKLRRQRIVTIRQYAHAARPNRQPGDRTDFTETLYWNVGIRTDPTSGEASIEFDLSDSITSFRVLADAFTGDGALGAESTTIESIQPFYIEPKLPLEVTMGDVVQLPVAIVNSTQNSFPEATLTLAALQGITASTADPFSLSADSRIRQLLELEIGNVTGELEFALTGKAGSYSDRVVRKLNVVPRGFPMSLSYGGMLKPDGSVDIDVTIPDSRIVGSVRSRILVYPAPLANLTAALERLIREPHGCFEQTSSTTYPLVMAQQYFMSHSGIDPKLVARSRELLDKGYKRLTGFECKKKGYEWFGQDPGHEALSAYGLLEFTDMAQVKNIDSEMLERTREWLLGTRDGKGGFKRQRRALHTWIADPDCSNSYITWALLEAGEKPESLRAEIDAVKQTARKSSNAYVLALAANVAAHDGDKTAAAALRKRLADKQSKEGDVAGATTSIVGSRGTSLQVETTALAVLAWLRDPAHVSEVESAIRWLSNICEGGRYGSTQSTVLALRAVLAYDAAKSGGAKPGSVQLMVDGRQAGSPVEIAAGAQQTIELTDIAELMEPGKHRVSLVTTEGREIPYSVEIDYHADRPSSSPKCDVHLSVELTNPRLQEGDLTEAQVIIVNRSKEIVPTPVAIIGLPGGLEPRHDQLKELVKSGKIAAYEVLGREVVLYWRSLAAEAEVSLPISLVGAIPGQYTGPACRAYLYYADEDKHWVDPMQVDVRPRAE